VSEVVPGVAQPLGGVPTTAGEKAHFHNTRGLLRQEGYRDGSTVGVQNPLEGLSIRPTGLVTWAALRGGWGVSAFGRAKLQRLLTGQERSQCGPGRARIVFTPYWTTFELPATDMRGVPAGILDQKVAGLK